MLTSQDLIDDLAAGCKPKKEWRIGVEHEQFAFEKSTGRALAYDGKPGIRELLEAFAARYGWDTVLEDGQPIALQKDNATFSLEPGGQIEYSGPPLPGLEDVDSALSAFYRDLAAIAEPLGIGMESIGFHPRWRREDINWMPKQRYRIMRAYMPKVGGHGLDMMLRTCGMQVNLDFAGEADMVRKYRVALALQPVITALTANSACAEGRDTGYASYRSFIWTDTDPARTGILPFVFEDNMGFSRYVDYALDVPMYFVRRHDGYIDVSGQSFRDFMEGRLPGLQGEVPTLQDWRDHLSTLFPEVRLKRYLELRGPDSNPPAYVSAMAAFWTGILYNESNLDQVHELIMRWPLEEHERLRLDAAKFGVKTAIAGEPDMRRFAGDMLDLAATALAGEASFLQPLYESLSALPQPRRCSEHG